MHRECLGYMRYLGEMSQNSKISRKSCELALSSAVDVKLIKMATKPSLTLNTHFIM